MIIYHGSKNDFKKFDYKKIGDNATQEGKGFYLTNNREIAERYSHNGYVLSFEFKGEKGLSSDKVTLTRKELSKYLIALHEENSFLDNYGDIQWEGMQNILNNALDNLFEYSIDDIDIISGICTVYGNIQRPLEILYQALGYDHSIVNADWGNQKIYLILNNNAIKYVGSEKVLD